MSYFNIVRFAVLDSMHNLYLGSSKHMMEIWTGKGILNKNQFTIIKETVSNITPQYVGRIPLKIASSFSGFTAD